jgi:hypothetical protein
MAVEPQFVGVSIPVNSEKQTAVANDAQPLNVLIVGAGIGGLVCVPNLSS